MDRRKTEGSTDLNFQVHITCIAFFYHLVHSSASMTFGSLTLYISSLLHKLVASRLVTFATDVFLIPLSVVGVVIFDVYFRLPRGMRDAKADEHQSLSQVTS